MNNLPIDLISNPRAIKALKRQVGVRVAFADQAGICQTLEGDVGYELGDAIMTGERGEKWPVSRAKFDERYLPALGQQVGEDGLYIKKPIPVLALRLTESLDLPMPSGGVLQGKVGDWLLQYDVGDYGIVQNEIFIATYVPQNL